ncbi:putative palmitoyltransferase ZDHHC14 [Nosema granulosis]|uniref:Palmitoyltransferase n=1 Tax=Nosema granulosis TaxID=83296 RepID=A0A9P6H0I4_9MICR|nr:putative palmitoyltransferase ZDHHC14 [Nosema granulosis]
MIGEMEEIKNMLYTNKNVRLISLIAVHIIFYFFNLSYAAYKGPELLEYILIVASVLVNSLSFTNISLSDPGFISKKNKNVNSEAEQRLPDGSEIQTIFDKDGWIRLIKYKGERYVQKYCEECNIFKTIGVAHCRECNYCVIEMDHHCFWFDTCIGRNNIRYFYTYIFSSFVTVYYFTVACHEIYKYCKRFENILSKIVGISSYIVGVFTYIFLFINVCFIVYYTYLLITDIRSRDFIKGKERHCKIKLLPCLLRLVTDRRVITCEELSV